MLGVPRPGPSAVAQDDQDHRSIFHRPRRKIINPYIDLSLFCTEINKAVVKHFFCILVFLLTTAKAAFCQEKLRFDQLPVSTQNGFNKIAAKYHTGLVDYRSVENDLKKSGIDFSNMPIEDAVMMMFMLIADDARKDMREMLEDMNATRRKRAALRQAEELLKKEIDSLKNKARSQYRSDSLLTAEKINEKTIKFQQNIKMEKETIAIENKTAEVRTITEKHLRSVEDAIIKLQQIQSRKKPQ